MAYYNVFEKILLDTCCKAVNEMNLFITEKNEDIKKKRKNTVTSLLESIRDLSLKVDKKVVLEISIVVSFLESETVDDEKMKEVFDLAKELNKKYGYEKEGECVRAA